MLAFSDCSLQGHLMGPRMTARMGSAENSPRDYLGASKFKAVNLNATKLHPRLPPFIIFSILHQPFLHCSKTRIMLLPFYSKPLHSVLQRLTLHFYKSLHSQPPQRTVPHLLSAKQNLAPSTGQYAHCRPLSNSNRNLNFPKPYCNFQNSAPSLACKQPFPLEGRDPKIQHFYLHIQPIATLLPPPFLMREPLYQCYSKHCLQTANFLQLVHKEMPRKPGSKHLKLYSNLTSDFSLNKVLSNSHGEAQVCQRYLLKVLLFSTESITQTVTCIQIT